VAGSLIHDPDKPGADAGLGMVTGSRGEFSRVEVTGQGIFPARTAGLQQNRWFMLSIHYTDSICIRSRLIMGLVVATGLPGKAGCGKAYCRQAMTT
jgi:hypothetical protein